MIGPQAVPFGAWKSPITSDLIVSETIGLGQIALDGEEIYWIEMRPTEGGRYALVRRSPDGSLTDVVSSAYNARTRVHEYGGGAVAVADGRVYFSNFTDQRLYLQAPGSEAVPLTLEADLRYADGVVDHLRGRMICVCEDHTQSGNEAVTTLVSLKLDGSAESKTVATGNDFYASPRLDADGSRLAWLTWNHPNMPWDGTELWVAELDADGSPGHAERVAGGLNESIFQPEWSADGALYFVSDQTGWWNLYRWRNGRVEPIIRMEAEFGRPQWIFGISTFAFESPGRIICTYTRQGMWYLASLDTRTNKLEVIETPYTTISSVRAGPGRAVFLAASPTEPSSVVQLNLATGEFEVLRRSSEVTIDPAYLSLPEAIEFPTEQGHTAHAFFYAPKNGDYVGPPDERPPLLVKSHGGPTSVADNALNPGIQYWTSRGIAVLDVNYGGSTGYGRAYRQRLDGQWGIVDVDDCANGRGGSAGGYTTLCALTFRDLFKAGASYFGVSDLEALAKETHKFESRYLDRLIGPYPERRDLYLERSPLHFSDRLSCPLIFLQGLEDKVVLPNQAELMVEALRAKGLPVAYVPFEGEQHGFRRAENLKRALDVELYFYAQVFSFELAEPVEPVLIENL
jgi:dipeptidyl aminopeptidase/acylaminoacyl peptidase